MASTSARKPRYAETAKAATGVAEPFHFKGKDAKTYHLPSAADAAARIDGGVFIDAVMDGSDLAQVRLGLTMLLNSGASDEAIAAIRALPMPQLVSVVEDWMSSEGVQPGESAGSSA